MLSNKDLTAFSPPKFFTPAFKEARINLIVSSSSRSGNTNATNSAYVIFPLPSSSNADDNNFSSFLLISISFFKLDSKAFFLIKPWSFLSTSANVSCNNASSSSEASFKLLVISERSLSFNSLTSALSPNDSR